MLKKPAQTSAKTSNQECWMDKDFQQSYPTLHEYLTQTQWADRSPRITATMTMYYDGCSMVVAINDRDNERSAFVSAKDFTSLMDAIERGLSEDTLEWKNRKRPATNGVQVPF